MPNPIQHLCQIQANFTMQHRKCQCSNEANNVYMMKILNDTKPNPTSLPNPSQYYHATHAVSVLKRGQQLTMDENFKQCQIQSNIFAKPKPRLPNDENFKQCQIQANIFAKPKPILPCNTCSVSAQTRPTLDES